MYCVGLTGNIGSGKSTVGNLFKKQGIAVISADEAARQLTAIDQPAYLAIVRHFGQVVLDDTRELNRGELRNIIFSDPKQRLWLEQLLHPLIRQLIYNSAKKAPGPYVIIEIPLLNKREDYPYLNRILLILAGKKQLIKRIMLRDNSTRQQAEAILATQADETARQKLTDDIIYNDNSIEKLAKNVEILHHQYLQLAKQSYV